MVRLRCLPLCTILFTFTGKHRSLDFFTSKTNLVCYLQNRKNFSREKFLQVINGCLREANAFSSHFFPSFCSTFPCFALLTSSFPCFLYFPSLFFFPVLLCCAMLVFATLCNAMPCYAMLCQPMLCYALLSLICFACFSSLLSFCSCPYLPILYPIPLFSLTHFKANLVSLYTYPRSR